LTHFALGQSSFNGNDQYTQILLHFNGANGSTSVIDSNINTPRTWSNPNGATISTAQSKFGGSALWFNNAQAPVSVYTTSPSPISTINYGTNNFTIDLWYYHISSGGHSLSYHGVGDSFNNTAYLLLIDLNNKIRLTLSNGSSAICDITTSSAIAANTWTHIAAVRDAGTVNVYLNGVSSASANIGTASITNSVGPGYLIGARISAIDYPFNGYVDEFRHSQGIARWTANFTPPSQPYG